MSMSEGGLDLVRDMEMERSSSPLNLRTANRSSGSVSPSPKKVPSRKMLLLRISRSSKRDEDEDGTGEDLDLEEDEGTPLDLSCPNRRRGSSSGDFARVKSRGDSCSSSSSIEWNRGEYVEDSDDSDGQPMDLGINPKAYKKSLMKRYRKFWFDLSQSLGIHGCIWVTMHKEEGLNEGRPYSYLLI